MYHGLLAPLGLPQLPEFVVNFGAYVHPTPAARSRAAAAEAMFPGAPAYSTAGWEVDVRRSDLQSVNRKHLRPQGL